MAATGSSRKTLDQRRALHAWERVDRLAGPKEEGQVEYAGEARKLPVRIMVSGLGQALAFLSAKSRKKRALENLLADLSDWVIKDYLPSVDEQFAGEYTDLLQAVINRDRDFLRWATDETLAYVQWINRFTEARGFKSEEEELN